MARVGLGAEGPCIRADVVEAVPVVYSSCISSRAAAKSKAMERKEVAVDKVQERDKVVQLISLTDR